MRCFFKILRYNQFHANLLKVIICALTVFCYSDQAISNTIFSDNFDSYTINTFPSNGGWQLIYSGAGSQHQYIDSTHSVSTPNSLHLVGTTCWSANSYHVATLPNQVTFEASVFVNTIVTGGCTNGLAVVGLYNPSIGSWGTYYGRVIFKNDGNIYASESTYDSRYDVLLTSFSPGRWYNIREELDLTTGLFDVYIDGVLYGTGLRIMDSGMPTGVILNAGHGYSPTIWFDDVRVSGIEPKQVPALSLLSLLSLTIGLGGYGYSRLRHSEKSRAARYPQGNL